MSEKPVRGRAKRKRRQNFEAASVRLSMQLKLVVKGQSGAPYGKKAEAKE